MTRTRNLAIGLVIFLIVMIIIIYAVCANRQQQLGDCDGRVWVEGTMNQAGFLQEAGLDGFIAQAFKNNSNSIYIRHGHDESSGYDHDQRLTDEGRHHARALAAKLLKSHGPPVAIYYSPFDRTTDTAKEMFSVLAEHGVANDVKIKIDPRLGKFFSAQQRKDPSVSKSTVKRGMVIQPSKRAFQKALDEQYKEVKSKHGTDVVWNITHAIGVNHHLKKLTGHGDSIDYLRSIVAQQH